MGEHEIVETLTSPLVFEIFVPGYIIYHRGILVYFSNMGYTVHEMRAKSGMFWRGKRYSGKMWRIVLEAPNEEKLIWDTLRGEFAELEWKMLHGCFKF